MYRVGIEGQCKRVALHINDSCHYVCLYVCQQVVMNWTVVYLLGHVHTIDPKVRMTTVWNKP